MVYLLLADGFEEVEAISPIDILRRADISITTVSLIDDLLVKGGHDIYVKADISISQVDLADMDMLVLPGGGVGVATLAKSQPAMDLIQKAWEAGKIVAAICAAPTLLSKLGFLKDRSLVCHPTVADEIKASGGNLLAGLCSARDGNLITGMAAGTSIDFGLELVAALRGSEAASALRNSIYYQT